jgi:hypothetical protein
VLVESSDAAEQWALEKALAGAGYEVAVCDGPSWYGGPCPLVRRGECALAAGADVVVNRFCLAEPDNQDVVGALRDHRPETPVIIEARPQERERHADLLADCRVVPGPLTTAGLLGSVRDALTGRTNGQTVTA